MERDRGMKFILIPIFEAITIIVVPVYWVIKLAITFTYGALVLTILALLILLKRRPDVRVCCQAARDCALARPTHAAAVYSEAITANFLSVFCAAALALSRA